MTQVDFYVLAGVAAADKDRYACRIAGVAHGRGMTVYMQTENAAHAESLEQTLWTFSQASFVPHTIFTGDENEINREQYPVLIGDQNAPDGWTDVLISLQQKPVTDYKRFTRIAELILNTDREKKSARERFKFYREQGINPNTHKV